MDITYYLIGDPQTGRVIGPLQEPGVAIKVSKSVWKAYKAGDRFLLTDIDEPHRSRWLKERRRWLRNKYARTPLRVPLVG